jgi:hypothetical protein
MRRLRLVGLVVVLALGSVAAVRAAHDLTGRWSLAVVTENGTGYPTLEITQRGDEVNGSYVSNAMGARTISGRVTGDTVRFTLSASMGGEGVVLTYIARIVTADSLNGIVDFGGMGGASFTGRRQR